MYIHFFPYEKDGIGRKDLTKNRIMSPAHERQRRRGAPATRDVLQAGTGIDFGDWLAIEA